MFQDYEEEIITHNLMSDVNFKQFIYKPVKKQSDNVFSHEDTMKLLHYLKKIHEPYALAIQLSFYLFIRIRETKGLQWEDIDYKNRLIYLHRQVTCFRTLNDDFTLSKRQVTVANQMKRNTSKGFSAYDGKNLITISHLMGHSKVETTLHYLRNVNRDKNLMLAFENLELSPEGVQNKKREKSRRNAVKSTFLPLFK